MSESEFGEVLRGRAWGLDEETIVRVSRFRELLLSENERQNLTRLTSPDDFVDGHVRDTLELIHSGTLIFPAMDLGSGCGVPGLLAALMAPGDWVLAESEGRKADFLDRAVGELALRDRVSVFPGRGEEFLGAGSAGSVVARAVGKVEKIYGWIGKCSTWNSLVLLKGPGWAEEWAEFEKSRWRGRLRVSNEYRYDVGSDRKSRVIVSLVRR